MTVDERTLRARAKAKRLKARAILVAPLTWRVKCHGTCEKKCGYHEVREIAGLLECDCEGWALYHNPCLHRAAVERRLLREAYRKLDPLERKHFRALSATRP